MKVKTVYSCSNFSEIIVFSVKGLENVCYFSDWFDLSLDFSEINRVRLALFHHKGNQREELLLPDGIGTVQTFSEKLYVPSKEHPDVCYFYAIVEFFLSCSGMALSSVSSVWKTCLKWAPLFNKSLSIMNKAYNVNLYIKGKCS